MKIDFYFDPVCPWCWITYRWLSEVAPHRPVDIRWRTFSLYIKNQGLDLPDDYWIGAGWGRSALRVAEAGRASEGERFVGDLYRELGARYHHDGERYPDLAAALAAIGRSPDLAAAAGDTRWDAAIEESMSEVLDLLGDDIGVPSIIFDGRYGYFGPVISPAPTGDAALALFDSFAALAAQPGIWELKRARTVGPVFGPRP